jgi:class 3 adenylate cyclase
MRINWCRWHIIRPEIKVRYTDTPFLLNHVCGIDTSQLFVAKTGTRNANDLVWVGRAANYAAKLAALDHAKATWITDAVYKKLTDETKFSKGVNMWVPHTWNTMNKIQIHASTYEWGL